MLMKAIYRPYLQYTSKSILPVVAQSIVRTYSYTYQLNNKNINMDMTKNINIPDEANLKGFELVNKRAANMIYTIYGERQLTKILQIGGNMQFVGSLGRVSIYSY